MDRLQEIASHFSAVAPSAEYWSLRLVEEERVLTLQKGPNQIDFSWRGVHIDPDSIRIRILSHPDKVRLISVSYPPEEAALTWNIYSDGAWEENVRISSVRLSGFIVFYIGSTRAGLRPAV